MDREFSGTVTAVMMRKSQLYTALLEELSKKRKLSKKEEEAVDRYVLHMPGSLFLTNSEKENKKINYDLKLKDLKIDVNKVMKEIGL